MLQSNPYVIVISLDFAIAFDMVQHSTMLEKMAKLDMPEYVYNWLVEFFSEHSHCIMYNGKRRHSTVKKITASIIQGSGIGLAAYVVTAGDLILTISLLNLPMIHTRSFQLLVPAHALQRLRTLSCGLKVTICPSTDPKPGKSYSAI